MGTGRVSPQRANGGAIGTDGGAGRARGSGSGARVAPRCRHGKSQGDGHPGEGPACADCAHICQGQRQRSGRGGRNEGLNHAAGVGGREAGEGHGTLIADAWRLLSALEGPQRLIIGMLRSFRQPDSTMRRFTGSMHMFLSVQDAPARTFHEYHSATVKMDAAAPSVPDTDQAVKIVPEMSVNLLKFGRDMDGPEAVDNIKSRMGEDFPRLQDVLGLTQSSDMLTLDDFSDLYYAPAKCFGAPLDAQVVWPLPPSLNF